MQQKIQFIGSILHDPGLIVMDEPFSGLDPVNAVLLERTLLELKDQGRAILFSTHRMDQVEKLCDSICLVNNGEAVLAGKVREIKSRYERNHVIVEFEGSPSFLNSEEIAEAKNFSGHAEIRLKPHGRCAEAAARSCGRGHHLPVRAGRALARRDFHPHRGRQARWRALSRNVLLIARREYLEQIRGRAFRMSTIGLPVLFAVIVAIGYGANAGIGANKHIVVASSNAALANAVRDQMLQRQGKAAPTWKWFHPLTPEERDRSDSSDSGQNSSTGCCGSRRRPASRRRRPISRNRRATS